MTFDPEQLGTALPGESLDSAGYDMVAKLRKGEVVDPIVVANILEKALTERATYREMAYTDSLTGIASSRYFNDFVLPKLRKFSNSERRRGGPDNYLLAIADLNGLKEVNDTIGYDAGDALICAAAERIEHLLREEDIVARHGEKADEFMIAIPLEGIDIALSAISEVIGRRINGDGMSIAIGFASLKDFASPEEALAAAQETMKKDKTARKAAQQALMQTVEFDK